MSIRRLRCSSCDSIHTELPDIVAPYKHYKTEVICGVIDGIITPDDEDSEDFPSVSTMKSWLNWFWFNLSQIEGYLRNVGYSILKLKSEILSSDSSLLEAIRNKYQDWLERILRIIYNSGGFIPSLGWCHMHLL